MTNLNAICKDCGAPIADHMVGGPAPYHPRPVISPARPDGAAIALADAYEAGLRKMEASGYEEFAATIPNHKLIIAALRAYTEIETLRSQLERVPVAKPVAFRVPRVIDDKLSKTEHRLFKDEDEARQAATEIGADYDGLYLVADRRAAFFAQPDPAAELEKLRSQLASETERASQWFDVCAKQAGKAFKLSQQLDRKNTMNPRVTDNDRDEITVSLDGRELRGWSYANDNERRQKMLQAREYVEGWHDGRGA